MQHIVTFTNKKLMSIAFFAALMLLGIFLMPEKVFAGAPYAGGNYTNVCGDPGGWNYRCSAACSMGSGSCSGTWVVKFTCNGWQFECGGGGASPVGETSGGYQAFNTGISNQTQQIDVFDRNCRAGGGWDPNCRLLGFMVWYHPSTCTNTCPGSGGGPRNLALNTPAAGQVFTTVPAFVNFGWSASAGACGGNNCTGSCINDSFINYNITIQYENGGNWYTYSSVNRGSWNFYSASFPADYYRWRVTAYGSCSGSTVSAWRYFRVDRPPSFTGSITSNQLCNGNLASARYTGILPYIAQQTGQQGGINNPLTMTVTYTDNDGIADMRYLGIWLAENNATAPVSLPPAAARTQYGAIGILRRDPATGIIKMISFGPGSEINYPGNNSGQAICTIAGSNNQTTTGCKVNSLPGNAVAYAYPKTITPSGNSIIIQWELGLIGATQFNGNLLIYGYVDDIQQVPYGWTSLLGWNWKGDLTRPVSTNTLSLTSANTFNINYTATDNNAILAYSKTCKATQVTTPPVTITRTSPAGGSVTFNSVSATPVPCIDNLTGNIGYSVNASAVDNVVEFSLTATDVACNAGSGAPAVLRLLSPWLMTTNGDTYSKNGYSPNPLINIATIVDSAIDEGLSSVPSLSTLPPRNLGIVNNKAPYLSDYAYIDAISTSVARSSRRNLNVLSYNDLNGTPRPSTGKATWYDFLLDKIDTNIPASTGRRKTLTPGAYGTTASDSYLTSALNTTGIGLVPNGPAGTTVESRVVAVQVNGDLVLRRMICDSKLIFVINGNLAIDPDFKIIESGVLANSTNMNGCLFIVKGVTTIGTGRNKTPAGSSNAQYDLVNTFIITDSFQAIGDANKDGLQVRGGVITNQNNTFSRDLGVVLNQNAPSEIFRYDGGRYIYIFGNLLSSSIDFSVREKAFVETTN